MKKRTPHIKRAAILSFFALALSFLNCMENDIQEGNPPELGSIGVWGINYTTATATAKLANNGGDKIIECGMVYSTTGTPDLENNMGRTSDTLLAGSFTHQFDDLTRETTYNIRAYARNTIGVAYSDMLSFITVPQPEIPQLTTSEVSEITENTAISGGTILADGRAEITGCGLVYGTSPNPDLSNNGGKITGELTDGSFTCLISELAPETDYYLRAYATNAIGTAYGNELTFRTEKIPTVTDIDGNVYQIVKIGNQTWMAENLRVTHFNDGTPIPNVTLDSEWAALGDNDTDAAWCYYAGNGPAYGALYTWAAARGNICPEGWHLPTDAEWKELETALGMDPDVLDNTGWRGVSEGAKLAGHAEFWANGNLVKAEEFGESGFGAIGGGYRNSGTGVLSGIRQEGRWWSGAMDGSVTNVWRRRLTPMDKRIARVSEPKSSGCSIRCIKD